MLTVKLKLWTLILLGSLALGASAMAAPADTVKSLPGIEIRTAVDKAEMYVGDPVKYQVTITHDPSITLLPPPLGANLGAFDVKDYQADVQTKLKDGRIQNQTTFVLSTFTTGDYVIPAVPLVFQMPDSSRKVMLTEPVPIKVKSLLENAGDSTDIKPLKNPYEFKRNLTIYFVLGGLFLLLIVAALVFLRLRKKAAQAEPVDTRPGWEIAFEKLALLREKRLLDEGKLKIYYIELSEILRWFLGKVYGVAVLDMTTDEFLDQFGQMSLPDALYDRSAAFLKHADLVKFAKYVPERERADADFSVVHELVELVRADIEQKQQAAKAAQAAQTPTTTGGTTP